MPFKTELVVVLLLRILKGPDELIRLRAEAITLMFCIGIPILKQVPTLITVFASYPCPGHGEIPLM